MQDEILCEYGRIASISTEPQAVSGAFRPRLGAQYPFLCDEGGALAAELDLLELTDVKHSPFLPFTFLLDSTLVVRQIWCGFWYWGNPTPEELRRALRDVTRAEQPTYDAQGVWSGAVPAGPRAGIVAPVVWIREDPEGREIWRGAHDGPIPDIGAEVGRSAVDGRRWLVNAIERDGDAVAMLLRKE